MRTAAERRIVGRAATCLGCLLAVCGLALAAGTAQAGARVASVGLGRAWLVHHGQGPSTLLIPVRYPIQMSGRLLELSVSLRRPDGSELRSWVLHERASAGTLRQPERRRRFTFVHRLGLGERSSRVVGDGHGGFTARIHANGVLDTDPGPDLRGGDFEIPGLGRFPKRRLCSSVPRLRVRPGKRISVPLPVCGGPVRWRLDRPPEHGAARIRHGRLIYRAAQRFRGSDSIRLANRAGHSATASAAESIAAPVQIVVGSRGGAVVRALGDSVTAGFGYYDNGAEMFLTSLPSCKPGASAYNDACSSNSANRSNRGTVVNYAPDYGLANNVSWAAQWANAHGVTDYENLAISGSEPSDWAPAGQFYATTKRVEAEDPDYVLMTVGANPLLSDMLFGVDNIGCALEADIVGGFRECIEAAFASVQLRANLKSLYTDLVAKSDATIYLMQYPTSIPAVALTYSATQLAMTGKLLNREIVSVAGEVSPTRLQPVAPPHFNVGIDISPVFPSRYSCSRLGFRVDGQSVQAEPSQDELELDHPLSFCPGPAAGPPWVISGDTGVHPSAAGYAQMAAQVPAPE